MRPIIRSVSAAELRAIYNEHFAWRVAAGEFVERLVDWAHPSPVRSNQPYRTESHYVEYRDRDGTLRVGGHRYKRPDGVIATKNRLDPKWILYEGVIYKQAPRA